VLRLCAIILAIWIIVPSAYGQSVIDAGEPDATELTIYPENLAMITEVYHLDIPEGRSTIRFLGVSDLIIPQSAVLRQFSGVTIERNFDVDLISKSSLLANSVGEIVTLTRHHRATGTVTRKRARIISASPSTGVVFDINGRIEALECSGLSEAVAFSAIPDGLNPSPVLSMDVSATEAGKKELIISYLSTGMEWSADYRLDENADHKTGSLLGWLTIKNRTSKSYKSVPLAVIAGKLNRDQSAGILTVSPDLRSQSAAFWPKGSTKTGLIVREGTHGVDRFEPGFAPPPLMAQRFNDLSADEIVVTGSRVKRATREDIGDYKLYRPPFPVSLSAMQTKQIAFLDKSAVEFDRVFEFDFPFRRKNQVLNAAVEYRIDNDKDGKLAEPLPVGVFRVMTKRRNGQTAYLGEDTVKNSPVGVPVKLGISDSMAVTAQMEIKNASETKFGQTRHKLILSGAISNATRETVDTEVILKDEMIRKDDIFRASHRFDRDEIIPTLQVPVQPESIEKFSMELAIESVQVFDLDDLNLDRSDLGKRKESYPDPAYLLAGHGDTASWVSDYFPPPKDYKIEVHSTLLAYTETDTEDERTELEFSMQHAFVNNDEVPVTMVFSMREFCAGDLEIIQSSRKPEEECPYFWKFKLDAGQTRTLTYTAKIPDY